MHDLSSDDKNWVQEARDFWLSRGIKLEPGSQVKDIEATEAAVGFIFPLDMKELYRVFNGFENCDWTPGMISIWPLKRIEKEYVAAADKSFVGFCDFLICSHLIGFV